MQAAQSENRPTVEQLYRTQRPRLIEALARRAGLPERDVEDIAQEAFVRLIDGRRRYEPVIAQGELWWYVWDLVRSYRAARRRSTIVELTELKANRTHARSGVDGDDWAARLVSDGETELPVEEGGGVAVIHDPFAPTQADSAIGQPARDLLDDVERLHLESASVPPPLSRPLPRWRIDQVLAANLGGRALLLVARGADVNTVAHRFEIETPTLIGMMREAQRDAESLVSQSPSHRGGSPSHLAALADLEAPSSVPNSATFQVKVLVRSKDEALPRTNPMLDRLHVWLTVSESFRAKGPTFVPLLRYIAGPYTHAAFFDVTARGEPDRDVEGYVSARFLRDGRPSGKVTVTVTARTPA